MNKIVFNSSWTLYTHEIQDTDYSLESYKKLFTTKNYKEYVEYMNEINEEEWSRKLYFFMRDDITPRYEDCNNVDGCYWAYRINKNYSYTTWFALNLLLMGECLFDDIHLMSNVNGISLSPKNNTTTIRIWFKKNDILLNNETNNHKFSYTIPNIDITKYKFGLNVN
jgi:hypothetical protein